MIVCIHTKLVSSHSFHLGNASSVLIHQESGHVDRKDPYITYFLLVISCLAGLSLIHRLSTIQVATTLTTASSTVRGVAWGRGYRWEQSLVISCGASLSSSTVRVVTWEWGYRSRWGSLAITDDLCATVRGVPWRWCVCVFVCVCVMCVGELIH